MIDHRFRVMEQIGDADGGDERGVLDERYCLVCNRREHHLEHLRQHDVQTDLHGCKAENLRRLVLTLLDREQTAAEYLCKVCRIVEHEGECCCGEALHGKIFTDNGDERQSEIEEEQLEHQRRSAHDEHECPSNGAEHLALARHEKAQQKPEREREQYRD